MTAARPPHKNRPPDRFPRHLLADTTVGSAGAAARLPGTQVSLQEARAITWDEIDPKAGTVAVYRSVRVKGDTKRRKSRRAPGGRGATPMSTMINDDSISLEDDSISLEIDGRVIVTAEFREHAPADGHGAWIVSCHPGRLFTRNQAITAIVLAERLAVGLRRR